MNARIVRVIRSAPPWRIVVFALLPGFICLGQASRSYDFSQASLEDLMNVKVTSVSKKEQKLSNAGAAVFVITQEDIRRSGAANIPDLLRMAPGVQAAQIDAETWAISIRGFNGRYSDKVLVLVDGRTVYSPDSAGVLWSEVDVPLEDIDRVEVVRGPGGTVWGANAMNGVIIITTKSSKEGQGGLLTAGGGLHQAANGLVQYGEDVGTHGAYRIWGKYFNVGSTQFPNHIRAGDGWHQSHGGFRTDWTLSRSDSLTVQGDLLATSGSETVTTLLSSSPQSGEVTLNSPIDIKNGNILSRWTHTFSNGSDLAVQAYYDRDDIGYWGLRDLLNTVDLDVQHHFDYGDRNDIVWGGGYRFTSDSSTPGYAITLVPLYPTDHLINVFFQDEISFGRGFALTFGSKLEHNTYTGFEYEPSAQLVWNATNRHMLWLSGARAIRQPARLDGAISIDYGILPIGPGAAAVERLVPSTTKAEELRNLEAGYRTKLSDRLSMDVTAFYSLYYQLRTLQPGNPFFSQNTLGPYMVIPIESSHQGRGRSYGGEIFGTWRVMNRWRLSPSYSFLHTVAWIDAQIPGISFALPTVSAPQNQFQIRSLFNLSRRLEWDFSIGYSGSIADEGYGSVPAYARLDTRLGWHFGESTEMSIVGQNLLSPGQREYHSEYPIQATLVPRTVFAKISWRF